MKKPEIFHDDLSLEDLLKPKAKFRVSAGFKQKVMEEAKAIPVRCRRRWIHLVATPAVAAAIAALVIIAVMHFHDRNASSENPATTTSVERSIQTPPDTLYKYKEIPTRLIAEASQLKQDNPPVRKSTSKKRPKSKKATSTVSFSREEPEGSTPQPVTEGEMPMISREKSLDPDEVRVRMLETRRNAEIAYIERMRDEIEANQAYIAQLMTEENVYQ